jgi:hypothetical protein
MKKPFIQNRKKKKKKFVNSKAAEALGQLNLSFVCGLVGSNHVRRANGHRVAGIVLKSLFTVPSQNTDSKH